VRATQCVTRRFLAKVDLDPSGCWLWTSALDTAGYGRFYLNGRLVAAHGLAYDMFVGPVGEGLELDHLCRVRNCVNPRHLEPVTHRENILRGETFMAAHYRGVDCGFEKCPSCKRRFRADRDAA